MLSRSWYGAANLRGRQDRVVDEVNFGAVYPDGSGTWEASFGWVELQYGSMCELSVFDEAWQGALETGVLQAAAELYTQRQVIGGGGSPSVSEVCAMLESLGFRDATVVVEPTR